MKFNYESWIKQAKDKLELLYEHKNAIENEIYALERGIEGFLPLAQSAWLGPTAGITESVVKVLSEDPHRVFAAVEIRNELINKGLSLEQKNPMATIHQVLARLMKKGWLYSEIENGKNRYRWVGEGGKDDVMNPANRKKIPGVFAKASHRAKENK